ncbi:hypothetical protein DY000_02013247 [Brassica cretica]|uniref:Uncharacterized protein n=1 Tax=Brassica cretica TaxID=69181 RepID=A0ABQ7DBY5_BRACR|nr:hypothetical protein DY000_02013246 [Brassica cretica]KAF3569004.1 hypothetical protein DY000_02013247 [Brassica cretica]
MGTDTTSRLLQFESLKDNAILDLVPVSRPRSDLLKPNGCSKMFLRKALA